MRGFGDLFICRLADLVFRYWLLSYLVEIIILGGGEACLPMHWPVLQQAGKQMW